MPVSVSVSTVVVEIGHGEPAGDRILEAHRECEQDDQPVAGRPAGMVAHQPRQVRPPPATATA